ncbi:hypothetical protein BU14_0233s0015 [Porphyra umbilicalis]|uniref:Uncharacterized protein n=1 Tax=Porphyra umbilicalis TaxID=2786 RepID=A0A1X6P3V8_PORUM|nr:hypothetical protein BU14_0233s0015 [Porphyra umbilicalis]|eukprot:OSX75537.1 hypothetical protein BU14_0233s0015 [Porphyra umbilicalis]
MRAVRSARKVARGGGGGGGVSERHAGWPAWQRAAYVGGPPVAAATGPTVIPTGGLRDAATAVGGRRGCRRKPARRPVTGCQLRRRRRRWRAACPPLPRRGGDSGGAGASGDNRRHRAAVERRVAAATMTAAAAGSAALLAPLGGRPPRRHPPLCGAARHALDNRRGDGRLAPHNGDAGRVGRGGDSKRAGGGGVVGRGRGGVHGVDAPTRVAAVAVLVAVTRFGGLGGGAGALLCRLARAVLPPSSASAAAAAADGSDAEAATDGDGAGEEGEEAGVVTDSMPPGEGVDWALAGWTVVVAGVAAPSLGAGAKARLAAAAEGLIVAVRPQPPAPVPADGMQETVSLAADTDGEADGRVRGEPGGGDADAAAEAHDDDATSVGSGAAPPAAATGAAPPPPRWPDGRDRRRRTATSPQSGLGGAPPTAPAAWAVAPARAHKRPRSPNRISPSSDLTGTVRISRWRYVAYLCSLLAIGHE